MSLNNLLRFYKHHFHPYILKLSEGLIYAKAVKHFWCYLSHCYWSVLAFDECKHHEVLNDRIRAAGVHRGNTLKCDQKDLDTPKWYKFTGAAGSRMPTSCVPKHYCGTHAPGWVSGLHPTKIGDTVNAKVCFHWGSNCCNWNANIQIKRCNGFYVYRLARTPVCWLRYCGNAGFGESSVDVLVAAAVAASLAGH